MLWQHRHHRMWGPSSAAAPELETLGLARALPALPCTRSWSKPKASDTNAKSAVVRALLAHVVPEDMHVMLLRTTMSDARQKSHGRSNTVGAHPPRSTTIACTASSARGRKTTTALRGWSSPSQLETTVVGGTAFVACRRPALLQLSWQRRRYSCTALRARNLSVGTVPYTFVSRSRSINRERKRIWNKAARVHTRARTPHCDRSTHCKHCLRRTAKLPEEPRGGTRQEKRLALPPNQPTSFETCEA